jgi:agmatinase
MMPPGDLVSSLKVLEEATEKISRAGKIPVILGGDHSIASADVAGIAKHRGLGKISMIHFDAHADTGEDQFGALIGHGTPMRRLIEDGYMRGDRFLQLGLRGYWPDHATLAWMRDQGMRSYEMTEIHHRGLNTVLDESPHLNVYLRLIENRGCIEKAFSEIHHYFENNKEILFTSLKEAVN